MSNSFVTPLRYPGGKGRLGAWLSEVITFNKLNHGCYVEPYAGGAGAAMYLLSQKVIGKVVINDIDPAIYSFWWAVLNDTSRFISLLRSTPVCIEEWHNKKQILNDMDSFDLTEIGFAVFYLNRTNRSGIIRGGVIGGQKQTGKYKIGARYNKVRLESRVKAIAGMKESISLYNLDAIELLDEVGDSPDNFYYLDPPYFKKGEQLYRNSYKIEDHIDVAKKITSKKQSPWVVTYDNCQEIIDIFNWDKSFDFSFYYSTHLSRPIGREVCFYNNIDIHKNIYLKR